MHALVSQWVGGRCELMLARGLEGMWGQWAAAGCSKAKQER